MASKIAACAAVLCAAVGSDAFMPTPSHLGGVQQRLPVSAGAARTTRPKTGLLAASLSTQNLEKASTRTQNRNVDVSKLSDILKLNVSQERLYGKKTVVITGSSSGIGLQAAIELSKERGWHVIMACRSYSKAALAAQKAGMPDDSYTIMPVDLASLQSVRDFVRNIKQSGLKPDALICNAAVWYPQDKEPRRTVEGFEESVGTNHLAHFLMSYEMLPVLPKGGRILFIGTETANDGIAGKVPPVADLGNLEGMKAGMTSTIDGGEYEPTKAYKESKVCNAIVMRELNKRYGERGIIVNAMFPGCIAESPLFRQKRDWFRWLFPLFQKYVTKQFVEEEEAGKRIADVICKDELAVGGAYWKWNAKSGVDAEFELTDRNSVPAANVVRIPGEALDEIIAEQVWDLSAALTGVQVAPDIKITYDNKPEGESKVMNLSVKGKYVRDDIFKAQVLLKNLRALGEDITNKDVLTAEMTGKWAEEMEGDEKKMGETMYYWGRRAQTPIITMEGEAGDPEETLRLNIRSETPRYDEESAALLRSVLINAEPKSISVEQIQEISAKMDEINKPPSGLDAALFGERGTLKRLILESVSQGKIKP